MNIIDTLGAPHCPPVWGPAAQASCYWHQVSWAYKAAPTDPLFNLPKEMSTDQQKILYWKETAD